MNDETCKDCASFKQLLIWFDDMSGECTQPASHNFSCSVWGEDAACDLFEPIKNWREAQ